MSQLVVYGAFVVHFVAIFVAVTPAQASQQPTIITHFQ